MAVLRSRLTLPSAVSQMFSMSQLPSKGPGSQLPVDSEMELLRVSKRKTPPEPPERNQRAVFLKATLFGAAVVKTAP